MRLLGFAFTLAIAMAAGNVATAQDCGHDGQRGRGGDHSMSCCEMMSSMHGQNGVDCLNDDGTCDTSACREMMEDHHGNGGGRGGHMGGGGGGHMGGGMGDHMGNGSDDHMSCGDMNGNSQSCCRKSRQTRGEWMMSRIKMMPSLW